MMFLVKAQIPASAESAGRFNRYESMTLVCDIMSHWELRTGKLPDNPVCPVPLLAGKFRLHLLSGLRIVLMD